MSIYKELRYKNGGMKDRNLTWNKVDAWFRQAIALYKDIPGPYLDKRGKSQPLFIDLIVKIIILRAYCNLEYKKQLTAEKLIYCAETIINLLVNGDLKIVHEDREEAPVIPLEIL